MATYSYSPKDVVIAFAGIVLHGFADGTFCVVSNDSDAMTDEVGADGEVVVIRTADRRGSITVTLQQTSTANEALQAEFDAQEASGLRKTAYVKDLNGTYRARAAEAWLQKAPDQTFGTGVENREWVIRCANLEHGNV